MIPFDDDEFYDWWDAVWIWANLAWIGPALFWTAITDPGRVR